MDSSRQRQEMTLGGVLGRWTLSGDSAVLAQIVLRHRVEQFYIAEAELLDTRRFREWLALLDADIRYWMPVASNREMGRWDGEYTKEGTDLNWFDEGKFELEQRVEQLLAGETPPALPQQLLTYEPPTSEPVPPGANPE